MFLKTIFSLTIICFVCILAIDDELQWRTKGGTKGGKPRPSRGPTPTTPEEMEPGYNTTPRPEPPRPEPPRPEPPRPEPPNNAQRPPPPPALGGLGDLINNLVNVLINILQQILTTLGGILCELLNSVADLLMNVANLLGSGGQRNTFAVNLFKQFYSRGSVMDLMGQIAKRLANVLETYFRKRENVGYIGVDTIGQHWKSLI